MTIVEMHSRQQRIRALFRAHNFIPHFDARSSRWWYRRYVSTGPISPMRTDNRYATLTAYDSGGGVLEVEATLMTRAGVVMLHARRSVAEQDLAATLRRFESDALKALRVPAFALPVN
jgi:hypothetical protein